jgi:hypothetical protein
MYHEFLKAVKAQKENFITVAAFEVAAAAVREQFHLRMAAAAARGRSLERFEFLDCAMAPYRVLPENDMNECAAALAAAENDGESSLSAEILNISSSSSSSSFESIESISGFGRSALAQKKPTVFNAKKETTASAEANRSFKRLSLGGALANGCELLSTPLQRDACAVGRLEQALVNRRCLPRSVDNIRFRRMEDPRHTDSDAAAAAPSPTAVPTAAETATSEGPFATPPWTVSSVRRGGGGSGSDGTGGDPIVPRVTVDPSSKGKKRPKNRYERKKGKKRSRLSRASTSSRLSAIDGLVERPAHCVPDMRYFASALAATHRRKTLQRAGLVLEEDENALVKEDGAAAVVAVTRAIAGTAGKTGEGAESTPALPHSINFDDDDEEASDGSGGVWDGVRSAKLTWTSRSKVAPNNTKASKNDLISRLPPTCEFEPSVGLHPVTFSGGHCLNEETVEIMRRSHGTNQLFARKFSQGMLPNLMNMSSYLLRI